jgi:CubicO group peptidase (beta-lactamase class C family)
VLDLQQLAAALVRPPGVPGVALGVLRDGETAVAAAGVADADSGEKLRPDAVFRVASLTKPITATLVLTLVRDGRLGLEDRAAERLRRLHEPWRADHSITVRQLLTHQSGLQPDLEAMERFGATDGALGAAVAEIVGRPQRTRPGSAWRYANSGYWVLGAIAARTLGTTFEQAVSDRVLRPLQMTSTSFELPREGTQAVLGHNASGRARAGQVYPRSRRPSGGLCSTVVDVLRFAAAAVGESLVGRELAREAARPHAATTWGTRYGLGWEVSSPGGVPVLGHDGDWGGYQARLLVVPDFRTAVVALANGVAARKAFDSVEPTLLRDGCGLRGAVRRRARGVTASAFLRYGTARAAMVVLRGR